MPAYNTSQSVSVSTTTDRPGPAPERPKVKADLRKEPLVGVLLASGPRVRFTLLVPARIGDVELAPGLHEAAPRTGGLVVDGQRLPHPEEGYCPRRSLRDRRSGP